jgi:hypothetical protein
MTEIIAPVALAERAGGTLTKLAINAKRSAQTASRLLDFLSCQDATCVPTPGLYPFLMVYFLLKAAQCSPGISAYRSNVPHVNPAGATSNHQTAPVEQTNGHRFANLFRS